MAGIEESEKLIDYISKLLSLLFKVGVAIGGTVLTFYFSHIQYFPESISIGDGFLLIFFGAAFGVIYLFFTISITSTILVIAPFWNTILCFLIFFYEKLPNKNVNDKQTLKLEKAGYQIYFFAIFGAMILFKSYSKSTDTFITLISTAFITALAWSMYQRSCKTSNELIKKENKSNEEKKQIAKNKTLQKIFLGIALIIPLFISGFSSQLLDATMRLTSFRTDDITIQIKQPYDKYAEFYGVTGKKSIFGKAFEFTQFSHANIVFNGLGKNTVIQFKIDKEMTPNIIIPSDHILITPTKKDKNEQSGSEG